MARGLAMGGSPGTIKMVTPYAISLSLHDVTEEALNDPALRERLAKLGVEPKQMSIDQFGEFFREDFAEMLQLAKEAHIEPTD